MLCFLLSSRANIDEVETEVVEIEAKLDKVTVATVTVLLSSRGSPEPSSRPHTFNIAETNPLVLL